MPITYDDKVAIISNPNPEENKWTADNANEVKTVINDEILPEIGKDINRAWTETLLFDKKEIQFSPVVQSGALNFEVASSGNLVDSFSTALQIVTADGVSPISFGPEFTFIYGITNGQILEAGTYQFWFNYLNGQVTVMVPGVTAQESSLIPLSAPANFAAVADGENEIDLSWDAVTGAQSYLIEYSLNGTTGWTTLSAPAAGDTTASQTSLTPGDIRYYRIKAIGDGVNSSDSIYSSTTGVTDVPGATPPSFTFSPTTAATDIPVNQEIVITADTPIQKTDGSALTNANVASVLTLKETNSGGTNIPFTATIESNLTIRIRPTSGSYGGTQLVYVAINNVEAISNNAEVTVAVSNTFTTSDNTFFNGTSNAIIGGDILDSLFSANDAQFKLGITLKNASLIGTHLLINKYATTSNQRQFYWYTSGSDILFAWASTGYGVSRGFRWVGALDSSESEYELEYDGSIDTNDGRDRLTLIKNGSPLSAPTLVTSLGALSKMTNSLAQLAFGAGINASGVVEMALYYSGEAKDLLIKDWSDTEIVNIPVLREGTDISGNGHNMSWLS